MKAFTIRIDDELYRKIKELREKEQRSISGQIIFILRKALEKSD